MLGRSFMLGVLLASALVHAQPVTNPESVPPLAQIRDDKQLAEALATITQDPAIRVDDAKNRPLAAALMTEGVRQLHAQAYDQALANFLEAYNKFPSPKILLNVASTLRDMGRIADAANTYQRYLADPATGPERMEEVKQLLIKLDAQLTVLTVRVMPKGSEVSIDAGPFIAVGSSLQTRVRAGIHLVRVRNAGATSELTVNGFEGESKDVAVAVKSEVADKAPDKTPDKVPDKTPDKMPDKTAPVGMPTPIQAAAEHVDGWLITGTQYGTDKPIGRERHVRTGYAGPEVIPIIPKYEVDDEGEVFVRKPGPTRRISSGVIGILRIDGKGRGLAGGLGIAVVPLDAVELEVAGLKSNQWGFYLGMRLRFLTGWLRPYVGGGAPMFLYKDDNDPEMSTHLALGLRAAAGLELQINGHLSVQGDVGIEHFFNISNALIDGKKPDETVFVPTIGVIGRL